ncbi:MAG: hypothetical protein FJ088_11750, partial [Deltaproteobacteria bacterium]|nr:hypothetical protein [Deltaproteobacteria bacterium]
MSFEAKFLFAAALLSLSCVDKALSECDFNPTKACFALIEKPCGGKCLKGTKCDEETDGCVPCSSDCSGRACGGDGCGGLCGACAQGFECGADFHCVSAKEGCRTEETPGCGGCGGCIPYCDRITEPFLAFDLPYFKACGGDGCGGSCGPCGPGEYCSTTGDCVSDFINIGEPCLTDGECLSGFCVKNKYGEYFCSATCVNKCPAGFECKPDQTSPTGGLCHQSDPCYADCDGKDCGHNGCGGSCGDCGEGMVCDANGKCAAASNGCDARLLVPGCDGCGCEEEVCALMPECCAVSWDPIF